MPAPGMVTMLAVTL